MKRVDAASGLIASVFTFTILAVLAMPVSDVARGQGKGKGGGKSQDPGMQATFRSAVTLSGCDGVLGSGADRICEDGAGTYMTGEMFGTGNFGLHLDDAGVNRLLAMDFVDPEFPSGGPDGLPPFAQLSEDVFFRGNEVNWLGNEPCEDLTLPCIPVGESRRYSIAISWEGTDGNDYRLRFNEQPAGEVPGAGTRVLVTRINLGTWVIEAAPSAVDPDTLLPARMDKARLTSTGPKVRGRRPLNDYGLFFMPFEVTVICEEPPTGVGQACQ